MTQIIFKRTAAAVLATISTFGLAIAPASALSRVKAAASPDAATSDQAKVQLIINRGNSEISRRLTTLNTLNAKINSATKLSAGDKATLSTEVASTTSGLTALKTKLDADTTLSDAKADAQSIFTGYRVYALVGPKVNLVKTADDQQVAEGKLTDLATKLQTRITAAQTAGKSVTSLQASLTAMNAKISAAHAISPAIESSVIGLQPTDYNSNHSVLSGDRNQLKTAQDDIQSAVQSSATIISGLKNL